MKKLLLISAIIGAGFAAQAQLSTNTTVGQIEGFFAPLFTATNWTVGAYGIGDTVNHKIGGGIGCLYDFVKPQTNSIVGVGMWLRAEYDGNQFEGCNGSVSVQLPVPLKIFGISLTTVPFAYTGITTSFAGLSNKNFTPQGLLGTGLAIQLSSRWDIWGAYEKRTSDNDKALFGVAYHF